MIHESQQRYQEYASANLKERKRKSNEKRNKRVREGKTPAEIKIMDYHLAVIRERRKYNESIRNKRSFYNQIVKRDINISLLKNKQTITSKAACIAIQCKPAQNYLDYILETNPTLKFHFSKDELKKKIISIEKIAYNIKKIILPKVAVAIVLYYFSLYTQKKISKICGITSVTMRTYIKIFKLKKKG